MKFTGKVRKVGELDFVVMSVTRSEDESVLTDHIMNAMMTLVKNLRVTDKNAFEAFVADPSNTEGITNEYCLVGYGITVLGDSDPPQAGVPHFSNGEIYVVENHNRGDKGDEWDPKTDHFLFLLDDGATEDIEVDLYVPAVKAKDSKWIQTGSSFNCVVCVQK